MTTPEAAAPPRPNNLVGLVILAAFAGLGVALASSPAPGAVGPLIFAFTMTGWILAVMAHEFAHAATAYLAGDHTIPAKGYLSFDPRRYGDLGTSLVIPLLALALGGIGFPGGAVYLRHDLMRSNLWRAAASLAGPGATLVVLLVLAVALRVFAGAGADAGGPLFAALALLAFLQATALVLNLLPIPGLDGFGAVRPFLPKRWDPAIHKAEGLAILVLLAAIFLLPGFGGLLFGIAADIAAGLGVPRGAIVRGFDAFQFWR